MNEKEIAEYKIKIHNMNKDKLLQMKERLVFWKDGLSSFINWYNSSVFKGVKITKKMFSEKALSYNVIKSCWMGYMCRTCKKSEMQSVVDRLNVELKNYTLALNLIDSELDARILEKSNKHLKDKVINKLLNKLYAYVDKNKHIFSEEEVRTIADLIESGTIKTSKQLGEYGVN